MYKYLYINNNLSICITDFIILVSLLRPNLNHICLQSPKHVVTKHLFVVIFMLKEGVYFKTNPGSGVVLDFIDS